MCIRDSFDAYGNATHTALEFDVVGEDVLVTGAGPIGIMAAAICKKHGARQVIITDMNAVSYTHLTAVFQCLLLSLCMIALSILLSYAIAIVVCKPYHAIAKMCIRDRKYPSL